MEDRIERYIRSGHSGLCIVSLEERRVEAELKRAAEKLGYGLYSWSVTEGLADALGGGALAGHDPLEAIEAVAGLPEQSLVLMRDLHLQLEDGDPVLLRAGRETLARCKTESKTTPPSAPSSAPASKRASSPAAPNARAHEVRKAGLLDSRPFFSDCRLG